MRRRSRQRRRSVIVVGKVTPVGSVPVSVILVTVGVPDVVIVKLPAVFCVKVVLFALVIVGAVFPETVVTKSIKKLSSLIVAVPVLNTNFKSVIVWVGVKTATSLKA